MSRQLKDVVSCVAHALLFTAIVGLFTYILYNFVN